jgi:beta-glucanase (GH16 family)
MIDKFVKSRPQKHWLALLLGTAMIAAFVLPAGLVSAVGPNLALNRPATASSIEGTGFEAAKAVDGSATTRWASVDPAPSAQWIYVDLGSTTAIGQVILKWEAAYATSYQVQTSDAAAGPWTSIYTTTTGNGATDDLTVSGSGRYVRVNMTVRGTAWGYSLYEFEVYGTGGATATNTSVAPTATATNTSVAPTATRTNTPVGPTATRTNTPIVPTATNTSVPSGNLALNRPAVASSIEGAGFEAAKAVDGSATTRWASVEPATTAQWIYVDLGSTSTVARVVLNWEAAYATSYQVQTSNDASSWTSIYTTTTGNGAIDDLTGLSGSGRYVRVNCTVRGSAYGYSLWAFEVYGTGGATATNTPIGPTATSSNTPVPPTATNTSVGPTATRTNTPVVPTATRTRTPTATATSASGGWNLVWSDEFTSINTSNWSFVVSGEGGGNNERQYYTNGNNASIVSDASAEDNSALLIEARKENPAGYTCWYGTCQYTSARMITEGKRSWQYGKIEARMKLPVGNGLWPAFWMMGNSGNWPASGEIDIMELVGGTQCGSECGDNHTHGYMWWSDGADKSDGSQAQNLSSGTFADAYHIFGVEWDSQQIAWFIDGQPLLRADNGQPLVLPVTGAGKTEFHQPFYILMNIAVGGAWPLDPPTSTIFPKRMYVDWVRVSQK